MPRTSRGEVFDDQNMGVCHGLNRGVRRAFLCGADPVTGKAYDHRQDWVRDRLAFQAGIFAIDVIGYTA